MALLAALALAGSVGAQEQQSAQLQLTQSCGSGVSGTATLKDVDGGVEVALNMQGLPEPGIKHINHIHAGGTWSQSSSVTSSLGIAAAYTTTGFVRGT